MPQLKLYFIPRNTGGTGFYRMWLPASEIKDNQLAEVCIDDKWNEEYAQWCDIMIVQYVTEFEWYERFIKLQSVGKRVVYEIDDILYGVDPTAQAYRYWNPMGENLGRALLLMKQADAITVTTARLANEYALHNRNIHVLPNYLPKNKWDAPVGWNSVEVDNYKKRKNDEVIRILWSGAANHRVDLELISGIMTAICKKHPNVHFMLMGYTPRELFPDIQLYDSNTGLGQLEIVDGAPLLDYPSKLFGLAPDIGIAPLAEISFNETKSDLKFKEYSALSIPTVASDLKPYNISVKHGKNGYLAKTGKEWFNALEKLITDSKLRKQLGENARKFYEDNTIDKHINEWVETYQKLVNVTRKW